MGVSVCSSICNQLWAWLVKRCLRGSTPALCHYCSFKAAKSDYCLLRAATCIFTNIFAALKWLSLFRTTQPSQLGSGGGSSRLHSFMVAWPIWSWTAIPWIQLDHLWKSCRDGGASLPFMQLELLVVACWATLDPLFHLWEHLVRKHNSRSFFCWSFLSPFILSQQPVLHSWSPFLWTSLSLMSCQWILQW